MRPEILLCVSQEENTVPFKFSLTGIQVYSLEEAMYHTFHYWKQSIDDFTSDAFITWVNDDLKLPFIGAKMKEIAGFRSFGERLLRFLTVTDYFDPSQINHLKKDLATWERRLEWERLKERGDYMSQRDEPAKALMFYRKALSFGTNQQLLNNVGVALLQLEIFDEAVKAFEAALEKNPQNFLVFLNLAEALVYNHAFEKALDVLQKAEKLSADNSDIAFLYGELYFEAGNMRDAVAYYEKALAMHDDPHYIYRLSDVYMKIRQYDKALEILSKAPQKDANFLCKQAQVYAHGGNVPAAIKSIERALIYNNADAGLWTKLAMYHRLDYDLSRASGAIRKALTLDPENERAKLESARISKGMGKTKEYQTILNQVLTGFKWKYRETYAE